MLEDIIILIVYAFCGSTLRIVYGIYKAYDSFLGIRLSRRRILMEWMMSVWFGFMGGLFLTDLGIIKLGINFGALISSVLGPNVVDVIVKKFGFSKKMVVIVSDQQLGFSEFNQREMNALEFVKSKGKITNKTYQKINHTEHDVAKYELAALAKKKMLREVERTKGVYYVSN
jgi:hypothetical protein